MLVLCEKHYIFLFFNPQLFDTDNPVNREFSRYIFTTEGHLLPLDMKFHKKTWEDDVDNADGDNDEAGKQTQLQNHLTPAANKPVVTDVRTNISDVSHLC